jgi:hypothetical protein
MGFDAIHAVVSDPSVSRACVEIHAESAERLHAELVGLFLFCLARHYGDADTLDLSRVTRDAAETVAGYFAKFGVVCHLDGAPRAPQTELARYEARVALASRVHTLRFSLAPPPRVPCHASANLWLASV